MIKGEALHLAFGILGNATGLFLFLSPTVTFKRIVIKKSTEQFSGLPYVMTLLNCLLGAWYGLPFITRNNYLVCAIYVAGAIIESIYVLIFLIYSPKKERAKIVGLLASILVLFSGVALVSIFGFHKEEQRQFFCGSAATIFSVIMYASPLSVMVSNVSGSSLGAMQLILYAIYSENKGDIKKPNLNGSMEMGLSNAHQLQK
ncbi:Multitransmembrane protein [Handroanthus impetiginosus]|uniref:Multitransmembrane protein n=1 Tax=Handroanthus impetiginosus TaxID=429701 RepID=A0A2G9H028_9LAMI|nr:Multitransmembrane protein [Handroanthus impetiginosus]